MLVLGRAVGEAICIGDDIRVAVASIRGDRVRLGVEAPPSLPVHREEIYQRVLREDGRDARIDRANALRAKLDPDLAERLLRRVIVYLSGALRDAGCAESRAAVHDLARLVLHEAAALPSLPQSAGDSATHAADSHGD